MHFSRLALAAALLASLALRAADSPMNGTWRWHFTMPDGGTITPTLRVKTEEDGKMVGTARFRSGSSTEVDNFKLQGNQVSFEVKRDRDGEEFVTRYAGTLNENQITGRITSKWAGQEQSYDWVATRFHDIEGRWRWRPSFSTNANARGGQENQGGGRRGQGGGRGFGETTLTITREEGDKIAGKLNFGRGEQSIKHGKVEGKEVSFQTERERSNGDKSTNYYWGTFSAEFILGKYTTDFSGEVRTNDWRATRAD